MTSSRTLEAALTLRRHADADAAEHVSLDVAGAAGHVAEVVGPADPREHPVAALGALA